LDAKLQTHANADDVMDGVGHDRKRSDRDGGGYRNVKTREDFHGPRKGPIP